MKKITEQETAEIMADSLISIAERQGLSLSGISIDNWSDFLDSLFNDGGEVRCEGFSDLAWEYALQYGTFDSVEFDNKRWNCTIEAVKIVREKLRQNSSSQQPKRQNTIIAALQYFKSNYDDAEECFNLALLTENEIGELIEELEAQ